MKRIGLFSSLALLTSTLLGQNLQRTKAASEACGPAAVVFAKGDGVDNHPPQTPIPDGKANVYLIQLFSPRAETTIGRAGAVVKFGIDGTWKGATWGDSFVSVNVDPGPHHLCVAWQGRTKSFDQLVALHTLSAEAGKSYFYGVRVSETAASGGTFDFSFTPLDPDEARMLLESYPLSKLTPKQ